MAEVIKKGVPVLDSWRFISRPEEGKTADVKLPAGDLLLPFEVWQSRKWELISRQWEQGQSLGVWIETDLEVEKLADDVGDLEAIVILFPFPGDGRGYSQARLLRRMGFRGELRAMGAIERDYLPFLARVGFDAFQLADGRAREALAYLKPFSAAYQPDAASVVGIFALA